MSATAIICMTIAYLGTLMAACTIAADLKIDKENLRERKDQE